MKITLSLLIVLTTCLGFSQVTNKGTPVSWRTVNLTEPAKITLPAVNLKALTEQDAKNAGRKDVPYRFAHEFTTNYTMENSGMWNILPNGDRLWRIHFSSPGAKGMHFWFKDFFIPKGATLYVYNNDHTDLLGAYDERQNHSGPYFGTWPVTGDDMWLEYYEPKSQAGKGKLTITKAGHAYRAVRGILKSTQEVMSGDCNYDVECFMPGVENRKDITKHSVVRILASNDSIAFVASGAMVNNTANDGTPYMLSANHAWVEGCMYTFRFNWINPQPACPSTEDGDFSINEVQTISGATMKAHRAQSDFLLMEMNTSIPEEWGVILSGWDRTDIAPAFTYGVHHPAGDIMKVSVDYDPPYKNVFNRVWDIQSWNTGVTEGGSSGSPLLTPQGRIIGQLWYGSSGCDGLVSNFGGDSYGRFAVSWATGTTPETRLKEWLDPQNTGTTTLDAYPAQTIYANDIKLALADLGHDGCSETINPQVRLINYGSNTLTSATISYSLDNDTTQTYNWTGSLPENQAELIDLPTLTGTLGDNVLSISVTSANGIADENPDNNSITGNFTVYPITPANELTLTITTDGYASEISWDLTNQYGAILYSAPENSYENNLTYTQTLPLPDNGCYTFTIHDGYGDGICCAYGAGHYSLVNDSGETVAEGGEYEHFETTKFKIEHELGTSVPAVQNITVYPNPSTGVYNVKGINTGSGYAVYNLVGQLVKQGSFSDDTATLDISGAASGVYILKVKSGNSESSYKLVKE